MENVLKNATVTMPYSDFVEAISAVKDKNEHQILLYNIEYLNKLVGEVVRGEMPIEEAEEFAFFKSPMGKVVLANIQDYKGVS